MLFISQPSCAVWSIKGLLDFYSTQAVMRHLWEANFKSHWVHRFAAVVMQPFHKSSVIVPMWKTVCVRASRRPTPPLFGKMQMHVIKSNHRCLLFVKDVICYGVLTVSSGGFTPLCFAYVLDPTTHLKLRSRWSKASAVVIQSATPLGSKFRDQFLWQIHRKLY